MNISSNIEKKRPFSWVRSLLSVLPKTAHKETLLWLIFPFTLLLLNLGLSFIQPSIFTKYLPFIASVTVGGCFYFRTLGLTGSYLIITLFLLYFTPMVPYEQRLWHWGTLFSHALTLYIFLLAIEESEKDFVDLESDLKEQKESSSQTKVRFAAAAAEFEEREKEFIEEMKKLREEAEQRKIERTSELQRVQCIQSEIESFKVEHDLLKSQLEKVQNERADQQKLLTHLQEEFATMTCVHQQQLEETQHLKVQNKTLTEECQLAEIKVDLLKQEMDAEKAQRYELETRHCEIVQNMQESMMKLQSNMPSEKELSKVEGLYKQLRSQFDEKSEVLSNTRKELFRLEGECLIHDHQHIEEQLSRNGFESLLEKNQLRLMEEIESLDQEINDLEALVSHILIQ